MPHNQIRLYLFLYFLFFGIFLISCHNPSPVKAYRIGFSQCTGGDDWRKTMLSEMKRELSFYDNIDFVYRDADANSKKQVQQIEDLLQNNIDILIVSPNEVAPLTPAIEKAYDSGIPVVVVDRRTNTNKYTSFIGASNYEVGQNAGHYAVSILKGKGNVMEVTGLPDASPVIDRHNGFMNIIEKYPGIKYVKRIDDNTKPFLEKEEEILRTEKIDLVYAQNDFMAFDCYKICKKLGIEEKIKIIGIDGLPIKNAGLDMVANGYISATILYPTGGSEAIVTALDILKKRPYKKENQLFTTIIDSTNVRIMKLQYDKILSQQKDIDERQLRIEKQKEISQFQINIIVGISITLALSLILGGILYYYLEENKKITRKLELQTNEIEKQRNQLIELMEKLKEANTAKVNFFTNISHELRTPLTLIMAPLEDALSSSKLHFTIRQNLEFIQKNAFRLLKLINQLMDFRKMEEGKMKLRVSENNVATFVIEISESFKELASKKSISFNIINKASNTTAWFDVSMLDKVLFNLLSNAFKFTNENGSINVAIDKSTDNNSVLIKIEDTGIGMSAEDTEHAFDVFYQGHSSTFKGTGLGLALSKELILLHHGNITINSKQGKGTTFEISLPLGRSHFKNDAIFTNEADVNTAYEDVKIYTTEIDHYSKEETQKELIEKEASILIIEDNEDLRSFLKTRLESKYDIHEAENGEVGISKSFDIVPDLIISDIIMPGLNGLQITEQLKQDIRTSHIPIILLTAKSSMEEQIEGIKSQADAFIAKPFNLEHLEVTITNLLRNREVLRDHFTSELPNETRSNSSSKIDRKFINEFSAIVENNISNEDFSVDQICKEIGVSRVQLYRKVKALLGYNVNDYILLVRMQKAKFLLSKEDLTIAQVAFKVGFASQAYFSTVFKTKFGISPSEFKLGKTGKNIK